ncbi:nicotianamine synthase family protein [Bacillus cereus]|uniref:nicotianamine synthase family protein n=1 Tax=Bacillus cereus TaxID=1396 RepID=UPI000BF88468|nr:nicotianamine synthase family protein [Bacillus cereus]PFO99851.1 hypothetical protein COJ97_15130 [Bacillus cereus]
MNYTSVYEGNANFEEIIVNYLNKYKKDDFKLDVNLYHEYNNFIQKFKDNAWNEEIYNCISNNKNVDLNLLNKLCVNLECVIEKGFAERYLEGEMNLIKERLRKCENLMLHEGKLLNLNNKSRVLIIGSGAMPITAMLYNEIYNSTLLCLDIDNEALSISKEIINLECPERSSCFQYIHSDAFNLNLDITDISHIVIAGHINKKEELVSSLRYHLNKGTRVLLRDSVGIYRVIYSGINKYEFEGYSTKHIYEEDKRFPFKSIVLEVER